MGAHPYRERAPDRGRCIAILATKLSLGLLTGAVAPVNRACIQVRFLTALTPLVSEQIASIWWQLDRRYGAYRRSSRRVDL